MAIQRIHANPGESGGGDSDCLTENECVEFLDGLCTRPQRERLRMHIDSCSECRRLMIALTQANSNSKQGTSASTVQETVTVLPPGTTIERYEILRVGGVGGMGVVYKAHDPELDRSIALKLIRPELVQNQEIAERLLRESKAMAKISHANVVSVYDVGRHEGQLFIAMEWIEGQTLAAWLREKNHAWREVLEVFQKAGEGLAAAHRAGIIHRDFKPHNVMIDTEGHVRVLDFGLAYQSETPTTTAETAKSDADSPLAPSQSSGLGTLTSPGTIVGTFAYMAPEQHRQQPVDERTDQFSFCIAVYEGLYGKRPFSRTNWKDTALDTFAGKLNPPSDRGVPRWLQRAVVQGLSPESEDRFPSMDALLRSMSKTRHSKTRYLIAGALLIAVASTTAWALSNNSDSTVVTCTEGRDKLAGIWDQVRKEEIRTALFTPRTEQANLRWKHVERGLDAFADSWVATNQDRCEAAKRGEESDALLDLRAHCLNGRLDKLRYITDLFSDGSTDMTSSALDVVAKLGRLESCTTVEVLEARVPMPTNPAVQHKVRELRSKLDRADVMRIAGQYSDSLSVLKKLLSDSREVGYQPLIAEVLYSKGTVEGMATNFRSAEQSLRDAAFTAEASRHDNIAAESWTYLIVLASQDMGDPGKAQDYATHARAAIDRIGVNGSLEAQYLYHTGIMHWQNSDDEAALSHLLQAIDIARNNDNQEVLEIALEGTALVYEDQGKFEKALKIHQQIYQERVQELGADHPGLAISHMNLSYNLDRQGDLAGAIEHSRQALSLFKAALDPMHNDLGNAHNNLSQMLSGAGQVEEALTHHAKAQAIVEHNYGPNHPFMADALTSKATLLARVGKYDTAIDLFQRALVILQEAEISDDDNIAMVHASLAFTFQKAHTYEQSLVHFQKAMKILIEKHGPDHVLVGYTLTGVGAALTGLGKPDQALEPLQRAFALYEAGEISPLERAENRFALAKALWDARKDRRRASLLAEQVRTSLPRDAADNVILLDEIDEWIATRVE